MTGKMSLIMPKFKGTFHIPFFSLISIPLLVNISYILLLSLNYRSILLGTVAIFTLIVTFVGPENHSSHFEQSALAFEEDSDPGDKHTSDPTSANLERSLEAIESVSI